MLRTSLRKNRAVTHAARRSAAGKAVHTPLRGGEITHLLEQHCELLGGARHRGGRSMLQARADGVERGVGVDLSRVGEPADRGQTEGVVGRALAGSHAEGVVGGLGLAGGERGQRPLNQMPKTHVVAAQRPLQGGSGGTQGQYGQQGGAGAAQRGSLQDVGGNRRTVSVSN